MGAEMTTRADVAAFERLAEGRGRLRGVWPAPDGNVVHVIALTLPAAAAGTTQSWATWHRAPASMAAARRFYWTVVHPVIAERLRELYERPMVAEEPIDDADPACWTLWWDPMSTSTEEARG